MKEQDIEWQAVFFDFDGVIAASNQVKTDAFSVMFRKYGERVEKAVVQHHRTHGGISRLLKLDLYFREFLGKEADQATLERLGREFSEIVVDRVVVAPFLLSACNMG